ncbi:MAG: ABC transporter permease subunit [Candidatus Methylacidiphilales bacterium]|nr:ABC transporter permease subunit [Candidatus Methylacidiphilales bacterium]
MNAASHIKRLDQRPLKESILRKNKTRIFGFDSDEIIRKFFFGNAAVAVVVLGLITFSLFREGLGFFPQHWQSMVVYRQAGLEYVDYVRDQHTAHGMLLRNLQRIRQEKTADLKARGVDPARIATRMAPLSSLLRDFDEAVIPLDALLRDMTTTAAGIKERWTNRQNEALAYKNNPAGEKAPGEEINLLAEVAQVRAFQSRYEEVNQAFSIRLREISAVLPITNDADTDAKLRKFQSGVNRYVQSFPDTESRMRKWNPAREVGTFEALTAFILGPKWVTQSFWQDWYGFLPLFVGSLSISFTALLVAVPFGVGAAIYINQLAGPTEARLIKPYIEFISAIPSVVLGFFGIAVLGETIRWLTQGAPLTESVLATWPSWTHGLLGIFHSVLAPLVKWVPFFPISERLNIMTAGLLLALMAVPTIFTLSEDALNNVPRAFKEASYALGANRLQTIVRIIVPAALSGIISAVLLGFGRVIGETMVVLMCAGNRIQIPDFTQGLGALFLPVHTMTGIIAQEVPEVPKGVLQYRALFMLAIMLFLISLAINYVAQLIVKRYRISVG